MTNKASNKIQKSTSEFVSKLVKEFESGSVAIFCGAGISIPSGLPSSLDLIENILNKLHISDKTPGDVLNAIPFERFFELLLESSLSKKIIDLFEIGRPSANHYLIAKLAKAGLLKTICTTNFDLLIEECFKKENLIRGKDYKIYYKEEEFDSINWNDDCIRLIKIHGSVEDKVSMAVTLKQVAGNDLSAQRKGVIDHVFSKGKHENVLILGYSCSDIFDINPQIETIDTVLNNVIFIDHKKNIKENRDLYGTAEAIAKKREKNPFKKFADSKRYYYDTGIIVDEIWNHFEKKIGDKPETGKSDPLKWKSCIEGWLNECREKYGNTIENNITGLIYSALADYEKAQQNFEDALKASQANDNKGMFINCLGNLGNNYLNQKKYSEAINTFEKALKISKETDNKYGMSIQLENLGNAYSDIGNQYFIRAMNSHHEALKIIDETGHEAYKYPHLANLGSAYLRLGDFSTALKYNEEALKIAINSRDKPREAEIRTNIGSSFFYIMDYDKALNFYKEALDISEKCGDRIGVAKQYVNIGNVYCKTNRPQEGLDIFKEAKRIYETKFNNKDFFILDVNNRIKLALELIKAK